MHRLRRAAAGAVLTMLCACSSRTNGSAEHDTVSTPAATSSSLQSSGSSGAPSTRGTGSGGPATSSARPTPSSPTHPVPSTPLRTVTVHGAGATYVIKIWAQQMSRDCAAHAYGTVATYLRSHPCTGLTQVLATTVVGGKAVGFAQNSLGFTGAAPQVYATAGGFRMLVEKNGTGNLNDLLLEGYRLPSGPSYVPSPDAFDAETQDAGVSVVDAWYLAGPTPENDPALVTMAREIFLQY